MDEESNTAIRQCTTFLDTIVLCRITTKIIRLSPSDFDFRKRLIGNSGAFFCSSVWSLPSRREIAIGSCRQSNAATKRAR